MTPNLKCVFPLLPLRSQSAKFHNANLKNPIFWTLVAQFLVKRANKYFGPILTRNDLKFEIPSQIII